MPEKLLKRAGVYPPDRTRAEKIADYRIHMQSGQRLEIDNRGKLLVVHEVPDMRPKQILVLSDWHLGSSVADMDMMDEMLAYVLSNPDVMVIFAGDEIEGWSGGKHSQSIDAKADLDAQQQIEFMKMMYFEPLAKAGRVLGMVSEYWGHPGWLSEKTLNVWRTMVEGLDIDIIQNGGSVVMKYPGEDLNHPDPNKRPLVIKVWHNPPGAGKNDELSGQREVMQNTSESARPSGSVAGHIHRMQVAEEVYAGATRKVFYISAGALKGTNPNLASDLYGTQLGLSGPHPQGEGVTSVPRQGRRTAMNIPFANLRQGQMAIDALTLLNKIEASGPRERKGLLELIHDKEKGVEAAPKITYPSGSGINKLGERYREEKPADTIVKGGETIINPYSKMEMKVPYSVLPIDIQTRLPVALELIANARFGATLEGYDGLKGFMKDAAKNPHKLLLFLRNMIDKEAGKLPDRLDVLDKLIDLINGNSNQTLAIMMCESMRQDDWKTAKDTGRDEEYIDAKGKTKRRNLYTPPVAPGSYVATETNKPLIHHLSLLKLAIGPNVGRKTLYPIVAADKAEGYGSGSKPEWALQRLYDLQIHEKPGAVVGAHMPNAGAAIFYDASNAFTHYPALVAPGWYAGAIDSKGNAKKGAEPGQAIILMPGKTQDDFLQFPTVSKEETEYMHDALTLLRGLEILGIKDKVMGKRGGVG